MSEMMDCVGAWPELPLAGPGRSSVEASAGTGKTYTISALYLRALLELRLQPHQILVTTFTRAAAAEIASRVRRVVEAASKRAQGETAALATHPDVDAWLGARWHTAADVANDLHVLKVALSDFDRAAISTLDGICARIVREHPFAVGSGFVAPDITDSKALHESAIRDLWRRAVGDTDDVLSRAWRALPEPPTFDRFSKTLKGLLNAGVPLMEVPVPPGSDAPALPPLADIEQVLALGALAKGRTFTREFAFIAESMRNGDGSIEVSAFSLHQLGFLSGKHSINKAHLDTPAVTRAVAAVQAFATHHLLRMAWLGNRFWQLSLSEAREMLAAQSRTTHAYSFDGIQGLVHEALQTERGLREGTPLADALRAMWPIAMVDESQDTSAVQYGILDSIYRDRDDQPRGRLVMIGDPKQSIYRFRGADVQSYQHAIGGVAATDRLRLRVNFRSARRMVSAVNHVYAVNPSVKAAIDFVDAQPSGRPDATPLRQRGEAVATPLEIWVRAGDESRNELQACAQHVTGLLRDASYTLNDKPLAPGDIAVLLTSNDDVDNLVTRLRALGVPAVGTNDASVFETDTAFDLHVLLLGILHHRDMAAVRAAAATRIWGATYSSLRRWDEDVSAGELTVRAFSDLHARWRDQGALSLIHALVEHLSKTRGDRVDERWLTDLRHLGELIQSAGANAIDPAAQVDWLGRQRQASDENGSTLEEGDARAMRMESDAQRVRVMTAHKSKGLEFPVVVLPTLSKRPKSDSTFVAQVNGSRRVSVDDTLKDAHGEESALERQRLFYVALTRAVHACHVFSRGKDDGSALNALLGDAPLSGPLASEAAREAGIAVHDHWPQPVAGVFSLESPPTWVRQARALPQKPKGPLPDWHSFSGLTSGAYRHAQRDAQAAGDEAITVESVVSSAAPAMGQAREFGTLKGPDIGNALHHIMETRDFGQPVSAQLPLVRDALDRFGVRVTEPSLALSIASTLDDNLSAALHLSHAKSFRLRDLSAAQTRAEMAFHFAVDTFSVRALREACARFGLGHIVPNNDFQVRGILNGKIDLVFEAHGRYHVLDYKGNWVGANREDYIGEALERYMDAHYYRFQALIYLNALDRYLAQRLPRYDRALHLGQPVYLFLRAAVADDGAGIWHGDFEPELLDAVNAVFAGHANEVAA